MGILLFLIAATPVESVDVLRAWVIGAWFFYLLIHDCKYG